jgi:hypothetical protein
MSMPFDYSGTQPSAGKYRDASSFPVFRWVPGLSGCVHRNIVHCSPCVHPPLQHALEITESSTKPMVSGPCELFNVLDFPLPLARVHSPSHLTSGLTEQEVIELPGNIWKVVLIARRLTGA